MKSWTSGLDPSFGLVIRLQELSNEFSRFGQVSDVYIVRDRLTKSSQGIAYVTFTLPESAREAIASLDGSIFQGRLLHVLPAQPPKSNDRNQTGPAFFILNKGVYRTLVLRATVSFFKRKEKKRNTH